MKSETGLTKWFGFCKVLVETIFLAMSLDPVEWFKRNSKSGSKLESKKNPRKNLSHSLKKLLPRRK